VKVALDGRRQQPLQLRALKPDDGAIFRRGLAFCERLDGGAPIAAAVILLEDAKPIDAAKYDIVPAVGELFDVRHHTAAPDRIHGRLPFVIGFPARPQQDHSDQPIVGDSIGHHLAITRLENVQRQEHVWKQDDVWQRKDWEK